MVNNKNNKIDCARMESMINYYKDKDAHQKHLKGYIFDSLVYRYQLARFSQAEYEAKINGESKESRDRAIRDIMRFTQILNEAIGDHD